MPQEIIKPLVQHALDVAGLYKQNAALHRGLPDRPPRLVVDDSATSPPAPVTIPFVGQPATIPVAPPTQPSMASQLARIGLIVAATLGGGGLGGAALNYWLRPPGQTPPVQPVDPPAATGSLLQYLEDQGYHLPLEDRR
jgi:hypothetical protein